MRKETFEFFSSIFGSNKIEYYQSEIRKALNCIGEYKHDHGFIHPNIILYIQSNLDDLCTKSFIYTVLESFIEGKDELEVDDIDSFFVADPEEILLLAKRYVDNYKGKSMQNIKNGSENS